MRTKAIMIVSILILITGIESLYAQAETYTLEKSINTALQNNTDLKVAVMRIDSAESVVDEYFGYALPTLDFNASFSHFIQKPVMPFPDFETLLTNATYNILFEEGLVEPFQLPPIKTKLQSFALANNFTTEFSLSQVLFSSAVFRGIGASQVYKDITQHQLKTTIAKTVNDVTTAFNGALLSKEMLGILQDSYENAQKNYKNLESMYNQGLVSEYELLQVEVQVENLKPQIVDIENSYQQAKDGLKMIMGIDPEEEINIEGELNYTDEELPDENQVVRSVMEDNYELRTMRESIDLMDAFVDINRADYWPTIAAFGSYQFAGQADDLDFLTYNQTVVGVNLSINLFNGFRTSNKVQQAQIGKQQMIEQTNQFKDFLTTQVRNQILNIKKAKALLEAQERNVKLAQKTYNIAVTRYDNGEGTQLEIKNADLELRTAKTNRLQSIFDYINAKNELKKLTGNIKEEYLNKYRNKFTK